MHLVENYALAAGARIGVPVVEDAYFPIGFDRYITLHGGSGMPAKNYDYFKDVVEILIPHLLERNIHIVQIGGKEEKRVPNTFDLRGETNIKQCCYVIKKAMLHLGNDSFSTHVASAFNVPLVSLYGVTYPSCCGPFWGDKDHQRILAPDFSEKKPSFSMTEKTKRVNSIFPDTVADSVLGLLQIENPEGKVEQVHLGSSYHLTIIDVAPDFNPPEDFPVSNNSSINLRTDYTDDESFIDSWIKEYKTVLHMNRPLSIDLIKRNKNNIRQIYIYLSGEFSQDYIKKIKELTIPMQISYDKEDTLAEIRLKFFGTNIYHDPQETNKCLDNSSKICDTSYFKSSLNLFSKNKCYPSKASLDLGKESQDRQRVIDSPNFYREAEFFKIYNYAT